MNQAMVDLALKNAKDPNFGLAFTAQLQAREAERTAFIQSEVFAQMLQALKLIPHRITLDSNEASYLPGRIRDKANWPFATDEDINQFFGVVGDASVDKESFIEDPESSDDNRIFQHYGVFVQTMSGQGTYISISNR